MIGRQIVAIFKGNKSAGNKSAGDKSLGDKLPWYHFLPVGLLFACWATFRLLGDFSPIGPFFAFWATVYFDQFSENSRSRP
jgi:hypothetical protein